jgi:hypothetical protein
MTKFRTSQFSHGHPTRFQPPNPASHRVLFGGCRQEREGALPEKWFCAAAAMGRLTAAPKLRQMVSHPAGICAAGSSKSLPNNPEAAGDRVLPEGVTSAALDQVGRVSRGALAQSVPHYKVETL